MTYPSPLHSLGDTVESELRSIDAFYSPSTMLGGCQFSPGQPSGTSQNLVGFENKKEDALSSLGPGLQQAGECLQAV